MRKIKINAIAIAKLDEMNLFVSYKINIINVTIYCSRYTFSHCMHRGQF